jgi:ATP-dependent DNA helicase PIF1
MTDIRGNPSLGLLLQKNCLAPERLVLKKGALVMFVKNNSEAGYVNGTMGNVVGFDEDGFPVIQTYTGKRITAYPERWEIEDDGVVAARITQIPLRLAWAITIHKSQGMSLDAAEIDLGKSFVEGMGYVALSRVRTLEGIKLRSVNRTALTVNREIIAFDKKLREESAENVEELRNSYLYKKNLQN